MYLKKIPGFFQDIFIFSFFWDFYRHGNLCFQFQGFPGFMGTMQFIREGETVSRSCFDGFWLKDDLRRHPNTNIIKTPCKASKRLKTFQVIRWDMIGKAYLSKASGMCGKNLEKV